jgi:outer membrane protein insertion porin family
LLFLTGCSVTRTLEEGERLYTGYEIVMEDKGFFEKRRLKSDLKRQVQPEPNNKLLGLFPVRLWFYNLAGDDVPEKGFRHWMQEKLGQPPVIYEGYFLQRSENDITNYLYNNGYFHAKTQSEEKPDGKKKVKAVYTVETNEQYIYDSVAFPDTTDTLALYINRSRNETLIKTGKAYSLEVLKNERIRINEFLKNNGYFSFAPDYLIFELDTNSIQKTIHLKLQVKEDMPQIAAIRYRIGDIFVHSDYSLKETEKEKDTAKVDSIYFIRDTRNVKPRTITRTLMFEPGDIYSFSNYTSSLNRLSGLGIYKFINFNFDPAPSDSTLLDVSIELTQSAPKSVRAEIGAITKSNNYTGPQLSITYRDKNLVGGAELYSLSLLGSFETQISGQENGGSAYEAGFDVSLAIPQFLFPFIDLNKFLSRKYTPKSSIEAGYRYYVRTKYYRMNAVDLKYGYSWRASPNSQHEVSLFNVSYTRISDRTEEFMEILENNEFIRQSFTEELIFTMIYSYRFNNQHQTKKDITTYFAVNPEIAGTQLALLSYIFSGEYPSAENPKTIFGVKYSQYARIDADYRNYLVGRKYNTLVARIYAGVGVPYGNSDVLPFVKQFFIGGASDIRAFVTHSVGPGSYSPPDTAQKIPFLNKLEKLNLKQTWNIGLTCTKY